MNSLSRRCYSSALPNGMTLSIISLDMIGNEPEQGRSKVGGVTKIAILDDYIGVALEYGDWSALPGDTKITVYREAIPPERLVDELADYEVIVITQQRARFPRAVLEGLPDLKLIVCNGRTSNVIDHEARIERGILLCGTAETSPGATAGPSGYQVARGLPAPSEMAWALILAVAKRVGICLLYTSPSPRDGLLSRMPSSA